MSNSISTFSIAFKDDRNNRMLFLGFGGFKTKEEFNKELENVCGYVFEELDLRTFKIHDEICLPTVKVEKPTITTLDGTHEDLIWDRN